MINEITNGNSNQGFGEQITSVNVPVGAAISEGNNQVSVNLSESRDPARVNGCDLRRFHVPCSNLHYLVFLAPDGDQWGALIGNDLVDGVAGFGDTISAALRQLADQLEAP